MLCLVITYGTDTRFLKSTDEEHRKMFERRIICRTYGAIYENGNWRLRSNLDDEKLIEITHCWLY